MDCGNATECFQSLISAVNDLSSSVDAPNIVDWMTLIATIAIGGLAAYVAYRASQLEQNRAAEADRAQLRVALRAWFQTLSRSAKPRIRRTRGSLRSSIEEVADAAQYGEILRLMRWAQDMHDLTHVLSDRRSNRPIVERLSVEQAHIRRIIIKRRFRQLAAVWAYSRQAGTDLIEQYTARGWPAILAEPAAAAESAVNLAAKDDWMTLDRTWV